MIIDFHTHLNTREWLPERFLLGIGNLMSMGMRKQGMVISPEEARDKILSEGYDPEGLKLLEEMDDAGIDKSVVLTLDLGVGLGEPEKPIEEINKAFADIAGEHSERFIAFAGIDPRRKNAPQLFEKAIKEWGMKGLKIHPTAGFYPNSDECYALFEVVQHYKVPALTHSGTIFPPLKGKYARPLYLEDVTVDFPDLDIVAAHLGGPWRDELLALMRTRDNLFTDISSYQFGYHQAPETFRKILRESIDLGGDEKILFASDFPSARSAMSNAEWVEIIAKLPENNNEDGIKFTSDESEKILGKNAERILKIE